MTLSKRMTSFCITLVVASLFLSIYASAASAPIHKTTVWVAPETETLINGIPESQTPMVTDVIMGPYFYRFEILNSTADIYSSGFPENEYFEERDDLYDGNPLQPKNRKAIYLNSTNGILACMTFLYSEEELGKRMLTIDSLPAEAVATFQKEDDINIQETYEMVLEDQHCIVLLKFVSTESLQSNQEQAVTRYRASVIDFFEEYTQFLKSQENIE